MEWARQHSIWSEEGLLYAVSVVDIDVYVNDPSMNFEQLQDGQDAVIDVAEPNRLSEGSF